MVIPKKLHSLKLPLLVTSTMFVVSDADGMLLIGDGFAAVQVSDRFPGQMKRPLRPSQIKSRRLGSTARCDHVVRLMISTRFRKHCSQHTLALLIFSNTQTNLLLKGSEHSSKNMLSHWNPSFAFTHDAMFVILIPPPTQGMKELTMAWKLQLHLFCLSIHLIVQLPLSTRMHR